MSNSAVSNSNFSRMQTILAMPLAERSKPQARTEFGRILLDEFARSRAALRWYVKKEYFVDNDGIVEHVAEIIEQTVEGYLLDELDGRVVPVGCNIGSARTFFGHIYGIQRKRNIRRDFWGRMVLDEIPNALGEGHPPMVILPRIESLDDGQEDGLALPMRVAEDDLVGAIDSIQGFQRLSSRDQAIFIALELIPVEQTNVLRQIDQLCNAAGIVSFAADAGRVLSGRSPRDRGRALTRAELARIFGIGEKVLRDFEKKWASEINPRHVLAWLEAGLAEHQKRLAA